ncbi:MAG: histidine kinase [Gemmatimonadetes bacterium]|nr:histidine kinase [Gemmatimonadota bacterium]
MGSPRAPAPNANSSRRRDETRRPLRYVVAVGVTLAAWAVTLALAAGLRAPNYLPFAAAVAIATWYGGSGPAVLASALSILAIDFSFLPPISSIELTHSEEVLDTVVFGVVAFAIGATTSALRRAQSLAERQATDLARANAELGERIEQVQGLSAQLERTREEVLRMVAHDLRNPLHLMAATTEMLEDGNLPTERRGELAAIALRASSQMNHLIADLLNYAQIQAGRLSLAFEDVALGELIQQGAESFTPLAKERGIQFSIHVDDPNLRVHADSARVQQVLGNLLGNAFKFTKAGDQVVVSARAEGSHALVAVSDTGIGIAADHIPHLFEQFWQQRAGDRQGIGLGLGIAKGIVESHGGEMRVASTPGRGSTFAFTLPVAAGVESAASPASVTTASPSA